MNVARIICAGAGAYLLAGTVERILSVTLFVDISNLGGLFAGVFFGVFLCLVSLMPGAGR